MIPRWYILPYIQLEEKSYTPKYTDNELVYSWSSIDVEYLKKCLVLIKADPMYHNQISVLNDVEAVDSNTIEKLYNSKMGTNLSYAQINTLFEGR